MRKIIKLTLLMLAFLMSFAEAFATEGEEGSVRFSKDYYSLSSARKSVEIVAGSLIENIEDSLSLSIDFKDLSNEITAQIRNLPVNISNKDSKIFLNTDLSFTAFEAGSYIADITLVMKNGSSYSLGNAGICITDKTVIENAYVLNYENKITSLTEGFYMVVETSDIFVDVDKLDVKLLDSRGVMVAKSISGKLYDVLNSGETALIYEMEITAPMEDDSNEYKIEFNCDEDTEIVSNINYMCVDVTNSGIVVRTELTEEKEIKIYTENVSSGDYGVVDDETGQTYYVQIDTNGIGVFNPENLHEGMSKFILTDEYGLNAGFSLYVPESQNKYSPLFIAENSDEIRDFSLAISVKDERPSVEKIEKININQNNEKVAEMKNLKSVSLHHRDEKGSVLEIEGDIFLDEDNFFTEGSAEFEIEFQNGDLYTIPVPVVNEESGFYGEILIKNSLDISDCEKLVGDRKISFVIEDSNACIGTISIKNNSTGELIPFSLSHFRVNDDSNFYYTYRGELNAEINENDEYELTVSANDVYKTIQLKYFEGKAASQNSDLIAVNNKCTIEIDNLINISAPENLIFRADIKGIEYDIDTVVEGVEGEHIIFSADFSAVPKGYFTLKAYDEYEEVLLTNNSSGYNYGNTDEVRVTGSDWVWSENDGDIREFRLYGENLDRVGEASVKIYKHIPFDEVSQGSDKSKTKLEYVTQISLPKPYEKDYIRLDRNLISELESGGYTFIYVVEGKLAALQKEYISAIEPVFAVNVLLNDGITFTDKDSVVLLVSSSGYTKMRFGFSREELEETDFEPVSASKVISLAEKKGNLTLYIQFSNNSETEMVIKECLITVDRESLYLYDINISQFEAGKNSKIAFSSNKILENAFVIIKTKNSERKYVFENKGEKDGKYIYECSIYVDSSYDESRKFSAQIFAYDRIGNEAKSEESELSVVLPKRIGGRVTDNKNPLKDVIVSLYDKNNVYLMSTYTNADGRYSFEGVYKNKYYIRVNHSGYMEETLVIEENEFISDVTGKDFNLTSIENNSSSILIKVKDFDGAGISGAYVSAFGSEVNTQGKTDENGNIIITEPYLNEGFLYKVYVSFNGYSETKKLWVDSEFENIDFVFPQKGVIKGVALYGEEMASNEEIIIEGDGYSSYTQTNENGEFSADVYFINGNKTFNVYVIRSGYSAFSSVTFENDLTEQYITLEVKKNIKIKGRVKVKAQNSDNIFDKVTISGNGICQTVIPDKDGKFETQNVFGTGTYKVYALGKPPYFIEDVFEITDKDLKSGAKEINLIIEDEEENIYFNPAKNSISATDDVITKGDKVTVNVKFHNDGIATFSNVVLYAIIPEGTSVITSNGEVKKGRIEKNFGELKPNEEGSLTFTLNADSFNENAMIIPAYVSIDDKEYPLEAVVIKIESVSLSAPSVVKNDTSFKVSGRAISGSTVEILDYYTKEVLTSIDTASNWYSTDIKGIEKETTIVAKVTYNDIISYSEPQRIAVENNPVTVSSVKIVCENEYRENTKLGYSALAIKEGESFTVSASFDNLDLGATVIYSFGNKEYASEVSDKNYIATIENWNGYGIKEVTAFVRSGEKIYKFTVARILIMIAPTGRITDKETGEPIAGAEVLLEVKSGEEWIKWEAEPYLQKNPVYSDKEGYYGWTIPEGEYRIVAKAKGYEKAIVEKYDSKDYGKGSKITVFPIRTDVDIKLDNITVLELLKEKIVSVAGGRIRFEFNRPVDTDTLNSDSFRIFDSEGSIVDGKIIFAENNTVVLFKPKDTMKRGNYKLLLSGIKDKADHTITAEEIIFSKSSDTEALKEPKVTYISDGAVEIEFEEGKIPVNIEEIKVKYDLEVIPGLLRQDKNTLIFIPYSPLAVNTTYNVIISEALRTDSLEYVEEKLKIAFKTDEEDSSSEGGTNSPSGGTSEGGTGSGGSGGSSGGGSSGGSGGASPQRKQLFNDISEYDWAKDAIYFLYEKGIITGISETEFAPGIDIKRADYMLLIVRMLGFSAEFSENFTDVSKEKYYYREIGAAKALGLTSGTGNNMFNPEASITRQDMFVLAYRILSMKKAEMNGPDNSKISIFDDYLEIADYAKDSIAALVNSGLVKGEGNRINPCSNASRAETAVFIYRIYKLLKK